VHNALKATGGVENQAILLPEWRTHCRAAPSQWICPGQECIDRPVSISIVLAGNGVLHDNDGSHGR